MGAKGEALLLWAPRALSVLRVVAALLFLEHGSQKVFGFPEGQGAGADFATLAWWAGAIELVTGALILFGLATRAAAFIASGEMAFAYWIGHAPQGLLPINNMGDAAILYCFIFLYLVFVGPGRWSVDEGRGRQSWAK